MKEKKYKVSLAFAHTLVCRLYCDAIIENQRLKSDLDKAHVEIFKLRAENGGREKKYGNQS